MTESTDSDLTASHAPAESTIVRGISRRAFLGGLGALGLSACGGGELSSMASTVPSEKVQNRSLAAPRLAAKTSASTFVHPGLLHTDADFTRMATKVAAKASPWVDSWNRLTSNSVARTSWNPNPQVVIYRNDGIHPDNYMSLCYDVAAAYANALRWKITGDKTAADTAVRIMNAWSSKLTGISWNNGHYDGFLVAGIQGYQFANVGEIMRSYSGWAAADLASFQKMMLNVFYPMVSGVATLANPSSLAVYSNWDLCAIAAVLAIGVLCDDHVMFNAAVTYFQEGLGNGAIAQMVYYIHPGYLGQTQEAGRDQGHDTLSIAHVTAICQMAWNQGVDLFGYDNNRVLAACEYVAKGNSIESGTTYYSVPFTPYHSIGIFNTVFSTGSIGAARPEWALIYNHYVNRMGLAAPYSKKFAELVSPEGGGGDYGGNSGGFDQLGYGTLAFTLDPIAVGAAPSGLTAYASQGQVTLSWWGTAYLGTSVTQPIAAQKHVQVVDWQERHPVIYPQRPTSGSSGSGSSGSGSSGSGSSGSGSSGSGSSGSGSSGSGSSGSGSSGSGSSGSGSSGSGSSGSGLSITLSAYTVKRSTTSGGPYTVIATGITDLLTYTDTPPVAGTYYYVVTAITPSGESAVSNQAIATTATELTTYLAFNDAKGITASDSSGNSSSGTLVGGATWGTGKMGGAVSLDGSSGYVSLPTGIVADLADFSIAAWVYWNGGSTWQRLFDFGKNSLQYMFLTPKNNGGVAYFGVTLNGNISEQSIVGTAALPTGKWVHVAVTLAGTMGTLYVNGAVAGTNTVAFPPHQLGNTGQNWIGRSQFSSDPYFNGLVDEFRIYSGALSAAQVAALAAA